MADGGLFDQFGIRVVHHYAPLHYLPFIARAGRLLSKPALKAAGFPSQHLRSKSSHHDIARGFGDYAFLTLGADANILRAKLGGGFPHIDFEVPAGIVEAARFDLCRYNVAMTRYLRRNGSNGFPESEANGRYYPGMQIPIARTADQKAALLGANFGRRMIEILVKDSIALPDNTAVVVFSAEDALVARRVLAALKRPWAIRTDPPPGPYLRSQDHVAAVTKFIETSLADPAWRGDGLDFDKV